MKNNNLGIYIHIPFCNSKCFYCDFYSCAASNEKKVEKYIDALCQEIIANVEILSESVIDTIYIGGGTPTVIDAQHIYKILYLLKNCSNVTADAEITIEVNPETLTEQKLKTYIACGVNRVSMGLQTIHEDILKNIGRHSTLENFQNAYNMLVSNGIDNISTDIIMGLPGDNISRFNDTIKYILSLDKIKHISAYSLEVHENTKLKFLLDNDFLQLPDEDIERQMKHDLDEKMERAGFKRYEISNYAKDGYESYHNLKYWNCCNYLGLGTSSASYIKNTRYTNVSDIDQYISCINEGKNIKTEIEELDKLDKIKEYIILQLRLAKGIDTHEFKIIFGQDIYDIYFSEINECIALGLLTENANKTRIYLTDKGEDLANIVWGKFI